MVDDAAVVGAGGNGGYPRGNVSNSSCAGASVASGSRDKNACIGGGQEGQFNGVTIGGDTTRNGVVDNSYAIGQNEVIGNNLVDSGQQSIAGATTTRFRGAVTADIVSNDIGVGSDTRDGVGDGGRGGEQSRCHDVTSDGTACVATVAITIFGGVGVVAIAINKVMHTNQFVVTDKSRLVVGVGGITNTQVCA